MIKIIQMKCFLFISLLQYVRCALEAEEATIKDALSYAQLYDVKSRYNLCSGPFISAKAVVSPADCAQGSVPNDTKIIRGSINSRNEAGTSSFIYNVKKFTIHPNYTFHFTNKTYDIAVWEIVEEITNAEFFKAIFKLPENPITSNVKATMLGFISPDMPDTRAEKMFKIYVSTFTNEDCNKFMKADFGLICAGEEPNTSESPAYTKAGYI